MKMALAGLVLVFGATLVLWVVGAAGEPAPASEPMPVVCVRGGQEDGFQPVDCVTGEPLDWRRTPVPGWYAAR